MTKHRFPPLVRALTICALPLVFAGFTGNGKKVPITTSSQEARELYLKGRDLQERLQGQESLQYFEKAIAQDPNFGMAYLNFAANQPTAKGFFEQLNKAVALADKVSDGERLWILGFQAGVDGHPMKQREYYQKLVAAYPDDERAHNLLGNYFFGQQEFAQAIEEYKKVTAIAPNFSQPYNQLGYAYRSLENYADAEKAFQKYIKLIPDDPNPYDSYAELLLKMGRFDESIKQYQAALSYNPNFVASYIGISTDLCLQGKHADARAQLQKLYDIARNDGERRAALFAKTVAYIDEGNTELALAEMDKQYALAEKINDAPAMSGDLGAMGNILYESGKYDEALAKFEKSLQLIEASNLSAGVKENAKRAYLYNAGRVALMKKDLATAKAKAEEFRAQSEAAKNTFQIWLAHELAGSIALAEKNYDQAIAHFQKANQQNPYTLYRLALAYEGKGDVKNAKESYKKAARFNALSNLNYSFMRKKAEQKLAAISRS
ncbi:MAG: tetratricopeptide repeat protein [bacterium]